MPDFVNNNNNGRGWDTVSGGPVPLAVLKPAASL